MATVSPRAISRCLSTCICKAGSTSNGSYRRLLPSITLKRRSTRWNGAKCSGPWWCFRPPSILSPLPRGSALWHWPGCPAEPTAYTGHMPHGVLTSRRGHLQRVQPFDNLPRGPSGLVSIASVLSYVACFLLYYESARWKVAYATDNPYTLVGKIIHYTSSILSSTRRAGMAGKRIVLMLLTSLLASGVGLGGWSTPIPGLAQDTRDAADVVVYQEPPEDVADVSVFYEPLAPYGTWIALPEYGQVWIPHDMSPEWRPYTIGRWVYTDYGWTWVSDQEWGWAPFHYGRWAFVASYGWVWVPGTVWAPAWVAWRHAPGWVGWAPLPPQVVVRSGIEIRAANIDIHINPSWFCFVEEHRVLAPHVRTYIAPPARNVSLIQITQNVTHYTVIQNRIVNRSIPVERIERVIVRPVPRMRIVQAQEPEVMHRAQVKERAREVVLFRPIAPAVTKTPEIRTQIPQSTPPTRLAPGSTLPQQPQDVHRRLEERQHRERAALEERQRNALPPQPQTLSPEELRMQRETERRALEEKAHRDRQQREQQQTQQQLQQRQDQARQ